MDTSVEQPEGGRGGGDSEKQILRFAQDDKVEDQDECGATLIELALVLPIVFLMTFGLINFALVLFGAGNMQFACRAGVRYASIHSSTSLLPTTNAAINAIVHPLIFPYPANTSTTTLTYGTGGNVIGGTVSVSTTTTYSIVLPGYVLNGPTLRMAASGVVTQ